MIKNNKQNKGTSLIELIIALGIFSMLLVSIGGIATLSIKSQRRAFALQNIQESGRYIMESMTKEIRASLVHTKTGQGLDTLNITNDKGETFDYQFDSGSKSLLRDYQSLNPSRVEITGSFSVDSQRVTVLMTLKARTSSGEEVEINLQNTISPRPYAQPE